LNPFLEWLAVDRIEGEMRQQLQKRKEMREYQARLQKERRASRELFDFVDKDGAGTLSDHEIGEVIRKMFEKDGISPC
jgi:Ca2+-binding EF-hand superfamily protein